MTVYWISSIESNTNSENHHGTYLPGKKKIVNLLLFLYSSLYIQSHNTKKKIIICSLQRNSGHPGLISASNDEERYTYDEKKTCFL